MENKLDYYEVLQVSRTASGDEIKRSYRSLAMQYHPDRNQGNPDAEAKFKEVSEAYEVLKDEQKRAAYDRFGHDAFSQNGGGGFGGGFDFGDGLGEMFNNIFRDFMGGGTSSGGPSRNNRGSDLRYDIEISLEEAFSGISKEIDVKVPATCEDCHGTGIEEGSHKETCPDCGGSGKIRMRQMFMVVESVCPKCQGYGEIISNPCKKCKGTGRTNKAKTLKVDIPAGIDDGNRIRLTGEGEAGIRGGGNGDLYIVTHITDHKFFARDGINLYGDIPIPVTTAILGGDIKIPTLDGVGYTMTVPKGTQHGEQIRIKGLGMPSIRSKDSGDLYVRINVEIPTKLNKKQEELMQEFAKESEKNHPIVSGFWEKIKDLFN